MIKGVGGSRLEVIDPWRVVPDLIRRLRAQPVPPRDDVYEVPESLFAEDQDVGWDASG